MYQVELVWNREFDWVVCGSDYNTLSVAIALAKLMEVSGNGERVKKTRVVDRMGKVVWAYGKLVEQGV